MGLPTNVTTTLRPENEHPSAPRLHHRSDYHPLLTVASLPQSGWKALTLLIVLTSLISGRLDVSWAFSWNPTFRWAYPLRQRNAVNLKGKGPKTSSRSKEMRDERLFSIREEDEGVKRGERCDDEILPGTASDPILWRLMIPRFWCMKGARK